MSLTSGERAVAARVLTTAGWLTGTFHVPERSRFEDHLDVPRESHRLTDVEIDGLADRLPTFDLRHAAIVLVVLPEADAGERRRGNRKRFGTRTVSLLLDVGMARGTIEMPVDAETADLLARGGDFVELADARLRLAAPGRPTSEQHAAQVLVNASHVAGVSEWIAERASTGSP